MTPGDLSNTEFRINMENSHQCVLQWPARSPDISPIEHLWDHIGRQVRECHDVNNIRDLESALQAEWVRVPLQVIRKLMCNMRHHSLAVVDCEWWAH